MTPEQYTAQMRTQKFGSRPTEFEMPSFGSGAVEPPEWDGIDDAEVRRVARYSHYPAEMIRSALNKLSDGWSETAVANELGISRPTIVRWKETMYGG